MQLRELRAALQRAMAGGEGAALFTALYCSWCHSVGAVLSLCFLAQARARCTFILRARLWLGFRVPSVGAVLIPCVVHALASSHDGQTPSFMSGQNL